MTGRRLLKYIACVWFVGLLALPGVAYVLGERQTIIENRAAAGKPPLTLDTLGDPGTFTALDAFFRDRFPFREDGLALRGRIELEAFGHSSNPEVIVGKDGWLFYRLENDSCAGRKPTFDAARAVRYLEAAARHTGRRLRFIPAPAKVRLERDRFDEDRMTKLLECAIRFEERLERRLAGVPGAIDMYPEMRAAKERGQQIFRKQDTHWTSAGRLVFVRTLLDAIEPGLADRAGVAIRDEKREYRNDLAAFLGLTVDAHERIVAADPGFRGRLRPDVLVVGDSQMELSMLEPQGTPPIDPFTQIIPGAARCNWIEMVTTACEPRLAAASTIVMETVTRNIRELGRGCASAFHAWLAPYATEPEHARLEERWDVVDPAGSVDGPGGARRFDGTAPSVLRVDAEDDDVSRDRVVLVFVRGGRQGDRSLVSATRPQDGRPEPCTFADASAFGDVHVLPVAKGRALSDVELTFAGAPGMIAEAPRVVTLPGPPESEDATARRTSSEG